MKKILLIVYTLFINLTCLFSQNLYDSLLLHYPISGNCNDISINNYHATIINADLAVNRYGTIGSAYSFNGIDNYIEFPNYPKLKPQLPVSIAFWAKFDTIAPQFNCIINTDYSLNTYTGIWVNISGGKIAVNYGDGTNNVTGPGQRRSKVGNTILQPNQWYFFVFVVRGATNMDIYVNCKNDGGTYSGSGGSLAYSSSNSGVIGTGDIAGSSPYFLKGDIDDIYYWNRALDTNDVHELCHFTHVEGADDQEFRIYPNPASDFLNIKPIFLNLISDYTIYNSLGQKIMSGILNNNEINVIEIKNLSKGLYFFINTDGKRVFMTKFIKE